MSDTKATEEKITEWIDTQAESPYPIWAMSAFCKVKKKKVYFEMTLVQDY